MALPIGLLDAARNYLNITWVDAAGDAKLTGILERGMAYINRAAGADQDYTIQGKPLEMLLEYAMYVRAGALADYQDAYLPELMALQIDTEVTAHVDAAQEGGEG